MGWLTPDNMFASYRALTPAYLRERGIDVLIMDIDNTLAPYEQDLPDAHIKAWIGKMQAAGIQVDAFDALKIAEEAGSSKAVNIVLMGVLSSYFDFTEEEWQEAIEKSVPAKFLELNRKAFALGRAAAQQ
jgi:Pyruvate/2-oxoacid:ferredoxin oxidoreductase gamma subunit